MTNTEIKGALSDQAVLGLTLWAEARDQGLDGLVAVGCVIRNRVKAIRWPNDFKGVCLQDKQFSCWNQGGDANHQRLMALAERMVSGLAITDPRVAECLFLAGGIMAGTLLDRTGGANHYWAPLAMVVPGDVPAWAKGAGRPVTIGDHKFLKL